MQGEELVQGLLKAIEPVVKGIQIAAQNARCAVLHFCTLLEMYVDLSFLAHNEQVSLLLAGMDFWCTMEACTTGICHKHCSGKAGVVICLHQHRQLLML
jgi:hypothetical protein